MSADARLRKLTAETAHRYIELSTTWLLQRGEDVPFTPVESVAWDTPSWVRFLRWELELFAVREDGSADDYERLESAMRNIALLASAMAGIDTAEFAAFQVQGKGGRAKRDRDPRQAEKAEIRRQWVTWPPRLAGKRYKAAFARAMLDRCSHLSDEKTVTSWCLEWERDESESC